MDSISRLINLINLQLSNMYKILKKMVQKVTIENIQEIRGNWKIFNEQCHRVGIQSRVYKKSQFALKKLQVPALNANMQYLQKLHKINRYSTNRPNISISKGCVIMAGLFISISPLFHLTPYINFIVFPCFSFTHFSPAKYQFKQICIEIGLFPLQFKVDIVGTGRGIQIPF